MKLSCAISFVVLLVVASADAQEKVKLDLTVVVPRGTSPDASLYLAGNLKEVGEWKADGVKLTRLDNGQYHVALELARGASLEYKINQGKWETVEKGKNGEEIDNRKLELDRDRKLAITVAKWASQNAPSKPSSASGDIRYHENFASKNLGNTRRLIVWLPPEYKTDPQQRFAVLYMHDGQNCFDDATSFAGEWHADEIAAALIAAKKIPPIIIVAVANTGATRVDEYTPTRDSSGKHEGGGKADQYARFLVEEVKPFIDRTYRTLSDREHTAVLGSSLGGLVSLYLGQTRGEFFSKLGVISPSLWWDDEQLLMSVRGDHEFLKRIRIWIDMGTKEDSPVSAQKNVDLARSLAQICRDAGLRDGKDFIYREVHDAEHNERAWSKRLGEVLVFLFAP